MGAVSEISVRDARQGEGDVDVLASYGFWMPEREAPAQARWSTSVLPVPRPLSPILPSCFATRCDFLRYVAPALIYATGTGTRCLGI